MEIVCLVSQNTMDSPIYGQAESFDIPIMIIQGASYEDLVDLLKQRHSDWNNLIINVPKSFRE